jgi:hypothetical protein
MKCLYCGKRLALLRKLTDSEFCSDAHRKAYQQEHERMALERLMDAQKRFSAFTGVGVVDPAKPVTQRGSKAEAAPAPSPPPPAVSEELNGFLPLEPAERQLKNFWRFRPEIIPQMPEVIVPERQLQLDAFPRQGMIAALERLESRLESKMRAPAVNRVVVEPGVAPSGMGPELPQLKRPITQRGAGGGADRNAVLQQPVLVQPARSKDRLPVVRKQAEALTRAAWAQPTAANDLLPALWEPQNLARLQQGMAPAATVQPGQHRLPEYSPAPVAALFEPIRGPRSQMLNPPLLAAGNAQVLSNLARLQDRSAGQRGGVLHLLEFRGKPWLRPPGATLRPIDAAAFSPMGTEQAGHSSDGAPPRAGLAPMDGPRQTPVLVHSSKPGLAEMCEAGELSIAGATPVFNTWAAQGRSQFKVVRKNAWAVPAAAVDFGFQALAATGTSPRVEVYAAFDAPIACERPRLQVTAGAAGLRIVQSADGPGERLAPPSPVPAAGAVRTRADWLEADGRARTAARTPSSGSGIGGPAGLRREPLRPLAEPVSEDSGTTAMKPVDSGAPTAGVVPIQVVGAGQAIRAAVPSQSEPRAAATLFALETVAAAGPESQKMRAPAEEPVPLATPENETSPATHFAPQYPVCALAVTGDCAPESSTCIFPNPARTSEPIAPSGTIAMQELSALWPDSHALKPRLRAAIAEDEDLRDAVRAIREAFGSSRGRWVPNLRMPQISFQFSRPDWKWSVMLVPVLLLLAVYAVTNHDGRRGIAAGESLASGASTAVEGGEAQTRPSAPREAGFLNTMQQSIERRAAISFSDDFRSGLADWEGNGEWSRAWSYDRAGFLRTGPLALYRPSLSLTDYRMEFLGQIARKSIGWVYRARDSKNYYATKITLVRGGPLPTAVIDRYAVVNGRESRRVQVPLPLSVREDTLYRVRMDVRGDGFTLTVQGQVVDHWSDDRIKDGGVGFFSAKGEQARLRWVEISHQSDFLGKLCAFLAPYNLPSKDGSLR